MSEPSGASGVDLSNCDREPIHVPGSIQPFGCLIAISLDRVVAQVSENVADFLGLAPEALLGQPLGAIVTPEATAAIDERLPLLTAPDAVERVFDVELVAGRPRLDLAIHVSHQNIVIEAERHVDEAGRRSPDIRRMLDRAKRLDSVAELTAQAAKDVQALTGFDRVMVYRFHDDGSGEVVAEACRAGAEPYLGLRYPASDIPRQARALYRRNLLRIISDVGAAPVPLRPRLAPAGEPLDLSMSTLRAVSPIHIEYLRNMGVAASLSISILQDDRLWGLLACHHPAPRVLSYEQRTTAELYGQLFGFVLERVERRAERATGERARMLRDKLAADLAGRGSIRGALGLIAEKIGTVIDFDGIGASIGGVLELEGTTPTEAEVGALLPLLESRHDDVVAIDRLSDLHPAAAIHADRAAGVLAIRLSPRPQDVLLLFRREVARTVTWAGNPDKPVEGSAGDARLGPRTSFEAWRQVVQGRSEPWTHGEIRAAEEFRIGLAEVMPRIAVADGARPGPADSHQELLIAELNHRVRNILNLIRSVVAQSGAGVGSVAEFTDVVGGRIQALARAHEQITRDQWAPAGLAEMIEIEAAAYLGDQAGRVHLTGPPLTIQPGAFTALSLVIHELITNSVKYGAFSNGRGRIEIAVTMLGPEGAEIRWHEHDGPVVRPPTRRGFGSAILERSIPHDLGGEAELRYEPTGLRARFVLPAVHLAEPPAATNDRAKPESAPPPASLAGRALVLEDNIIIAVEAEALLTGLGASSVAIVADVADALDAIKRARPDFALLDVNLGRETSEPVAERLKALGVPFAFTSGYGEVTHLAERFPDAPMVQKPFDGPRLLQALGPLGRG